MFSSGAFSQVQIPSVEQDEIVYQQKFDQLEGRYKVLIFMNRHCPCTKAHYQHLNTLSEKNPQFSFYGIHSLKNDSMGEVRKFYEENKIIFPVINDAKLIWANALKAVKTPHVFVLDDQNNILYSGGVTNSRNPNRADHFYLKEVLEDISQGKTLRYKTSRTLGCAIIR